MIDASASRLLNKKIEKTSITKQDLPASSAQSRSMGADHEKVCACKIFMCSREILILSSTSKESLG